ncbi:MAG TPA: DUF2905 domain-containing protein [Acidobacteriaceae bacterium]|nr:DUF2905 domain-containing protein [Acidobacteriaceae bacterium]
MQEIGRFLVGVGVLLVVAGALILLMGRMGLPLGRLPGDIAIRGRHGSFYAPIATCLLISLVISVILWLVSFLRR